MKGITVHFRVFFPALRPGEGLGLMGSGPQLGDWEKVHWLQPDGYFWRKVSLPLKGPVEYKFVLADAATGAVRCWEEGFNRTLNPAETTSVEECSPRFPQAPWRGAGVAVPLFSLRTEDSFGVGDFHDLKRLADWAVEAGLRVIQLLPINDTTLSHTWQDSYPYNAVSSFALHPQFVHLPAAGVKVDKAYKARKAALEALPAVDYEAVNGAKTALLRALYAGPKGRAAITSAPYRTFVQKNKDWLLPYAVFSALRDSLGTPDFTQWGKWAACTPAKVRAYAREHREEVDFYCYVQFLLDGQLKEAVAYAHSKGVALKGDLPIGVSRVSVDVWQHPDLFHLDGQAGAPPDFFSADGQNWGFPTYNWEAMARDGYAWWRARLGKMAEYFDAFRIDHILGFFRIWEIPVPLQSGILGHFSPALPYKTAELRAQGFTPGKGRGTDVLFVRDPHRRACWHPAISGHGTRAYAALSPELQASYDALSEDFFWRRHNAFWAAGALEKLPALLQASSMLACGEDLGMVPPCVGPVMEQLHILGLEIQRMPKDPAARFARPEWYPRWSVCATGTHDTSTLRAWWEEDRALTRQYYNEVLGMEGPAPEHCEPWVAELILGAQLFSPSVLAILPLQDWLAVDQEARYGGLPEEERINIPSIARHNWRYRLHCTLESLMGNERLNARLRTMVCASGRKA